MVARFKVAGLVLVLCLLSSGQVFANCFAFISIDFTNSQSGSCAANYPVYLRNNGSSECIVRIEETGPPAHNKCEPRKTEEYTMTVRGDSETYLGNNKANCGSSILSVSCVSVIYLIVSQEEKKENQEDGEG